MIIKTRSITAEHAKNTLGYVDKEEKDHLFLDADGIDITSIKTMMEDFNLYKSNKVKNAFITTVISPSINDRLDTNGLKKLLSIVQKELKLNNRQFYAVIHQNTDTPHVHLVSNRIDFDGKVWNDHHVAWQCQEACKNICLNYNYTSANKFKGKYQGNKLNEKSEFHKLRNTAILEIKDHFKAIKFKALSINDVFHHLQNKGVEIEIKKFKNGLFGVSFKHNDFKFKASEIDRLLTIVPKNDSYTANNKFQLIIDNNIARFEGNRSQNEILIDIKLNPDRVAEYAQELNAFKTFISNRSLQNKDQKEENKQKYLAEKLGKRSYQIGFKIQI